MSSMALFLIIASGFGIAGTLLALFARPIARFKTRLDSVMIEKTGLKFLSNFTIGENGTFFWLRVQGVAYYVLAIGAVVLAVVVRNRQ